MTTDGKKLKLFASCIPVKGYARSVICDLQRGTIKFIPNDLYFLLTAHQGKTLHEIYAAYEHEFNDTINEYMEFLAGHDCIFWTDEPGHFPELKRQWKYPGLISNAILDISPESRYLTRELVQQLEQSGCIAVQLRFREETDLEHIREKIALFDGSRVQAIEPVIKYTGHDTADNLVRLFSSHYRVTYCIIHSAPFSGRRSFSHCALFYMAESVDSGLSTGPKTPAHLAINMNLFMESQFYNTYFNKKIFFDEKGFIKNAPESSTVYPYDAAKTLSGIIEDPLFQKNWTVNKDRIRTCRDCEFRYFCVDSRVPEKDEASGEYYFDTPCYYNPYSNVWT